MYEAEMTVKEYRRIIDLLIDLSMDAEGYPLMDCQNDEVIEKCTIIREMIDVLMDVPERRAKWILDGGWKKFSKCDIRMTDSQIK